MAKPQLKPLLLIVGLVFVLVLIIASGTLFFLSSRLSHLLNQAPTYTPQELYQKAQDQVSKGSYATAEGYLEQALLKQDDPAYRSQLAVVKYRLKKYDQAIAEYQKMINQNQDPAFAWNGIGNAYRDWAAADPSHKADYEQQAGAAYQKAVQIDGQFVAAYSNWALMLLSNGNKTAAAQVINQGIAVTHNEVLQKLKTQFSL